MPPSENEWHLAAIITPCSSLSLTGHILQCFKPSCSGEHRNAPQEVRGICSAKKEHYSSSHQISTSHLLVKHAKNRSKSEKQLKHLQLYYISQVVLYVRLSASTATLLVVGNTTKSQTNFSPTLQGAK